MYAGAFQDVVAPVLKALQVEVKEGFASVEKQFASVKDGFASVEKVAAIRHELILAELRNASVDCRVGGTRPFSRRWTSTNVLERVEARQASQQATA